MPGCVNVFKTRISMLDMIKKKNLGNEMKRSGREKHFAMDSTSGVVSPNSLSAEVNEPKNMATV